MADAVMWRWKNGRTFRPRMTVEHTGWSGSIRRQWCLTFHNKRGGTTAAGLRAMSDEPFERAWAEAAAFLKAIGAIYCRCNTSPAERP